MYSSLKDRVALVTGSGRGLGKASALQLAKFGAHVVVNDLDLENAEATAQEIRELGRKSKVSQHDISNYAQANALADEIQKEFGQIDVLVNNAGITRDAMLLKLTEEQWDQVIAVNLKGTFNMTQACVRHMKEKKYGKIIQLSSIARHGNMGQTNYSASKAGVVGMTYTLALELSRYNINVNAIAPGFIQTPMTDKVPEDIKEQFIQKVPLKKMGQPEDIAHTVCFLSSDESSYITGQVLGVDGGLSVGF